MKKPGLYNGQHFVSAFTLHNLILARVPERIRRFVNATYAANGGPEQMSLNDWIDADEKVERKLKNEYSKTKR